MDLIGWGLAFAGTLATETPVYVFASRRALGTTRALATAVALNAVTHPFAWTTMMTPKGNFLGTFAWVECTVWLVEALLLWLVSRTRSSRRCLRPDEAIVISLAANGFSAGIGLLL